MEYNIGARAVRILRFGLLSDFGLRFSDFAGRLLICCLFGSLAPVHATILWSDLPSRVVHQTWTGFDILGGKVKRTDASNDVLYFKFHVEPLSDVATEPYLAGFALWQGTNMSVAVGNAWEAWGYSAFGVSETGASNKAAGEFNLNSAHPEAAGLGLFQPYELPHQGQERTIIFKVQYVPRGDDLVTIWLNPKLGVGASDHNQPESLTTTFRANASFDQIRLLHAGNGNGWIFSDMAMATSFNDFIIVRFWQTLWFKGAMVLGLLSGVGTGVRLVERRKFRRQLHAAEQERALERERSRIARDLHDELGSSLTQLSMSSDLLKQNIEDRAQTLARAAKISQTATETVRALEEIVWALRPGSDTAQSLTEYIAHFAKELFEDDHVQCRLDLPEELPEYLLPPEMRHNLFLIVKEALTNAFKHARASEVLVQVRASATELQLLVADDGVGCHLPIPGTSPRNGLNNMLRRAEAMGGKLMLESQPAKGTRVSITVQFPALQPSSRN
jgi:signal transduction histidine kinase